MCIIKLSDLLHKLPIKTLLLTLFSVIFLSACGVKGALYQTSDQPEVEGDTVESAVKSNSSTSQQSMKKTVEPAKEQPPEHSKEQ